MTDVPWEHFPLVAEAPQARAWLTTQVNLGLAPCTIDAYGRSLNDYLAFSARHGVVPESASRADIAAYVRDLTSRPNPRGPAIQRIDSGTGLSNATLQQRMTVARLYYDYLVEEGLCLDNPVGRGRYTPGKGFGGARNRALIPRYRRLPWIPTEEQWQAILQAAKTELICNRFMVALAYDGALRRQCGA